MERKFFFNYMGGREFTLAQAGAEYGELARQVHDLCCWPIEAGKLRKEMDAFVSEIQSYKIEMLRNQMETCGAYTKEESAANWEWYMANRNVGGNNQRFLIAFADSLKKRGVTL